jgi:N-acetylglucosamine-6-phosphate deacetylase
MTIVTGQIVTPNDAHPGWVRVVGDRISAVGLGSPAPGVRAEPLLATDGFVLPGLVDTHCHGALGSGFGADPAQATAAARHHHRSGTTTLIGSLVSEPPEVLAQQVDSLVALIQEGVLDGIHLEGPYLAADYRGAHHRAALREPDAREMSHLRDAIGSIPCTVTLAPELHGATALIKELSAAGLRVALGHMAATFEETQAGLDAGARVATHLCNGMPPIHHREPGPVVALLSDDRVDCELITDSHHLSGDFVRWLWNLLPAQRRVLVSDASPATGLPDGTVSMGGESLKLCCGRVETADGRSLAGSANTLLDNVRWAHSLGLPLSDVVMAASCNPARSLGFADRGAVAMGNIADLLVTDDELRPIAVMRRGQWL